MAKKKVSKKNKKKLTSEQANGMEISLPEDKIKYLEAQTKSLELQLAHRVENCVSTTLEYESMKKSLHEAVQKYDFEKERTVGLTRDMTRQYKGMQDDLLNKLDAREKMIQDLTDTMIVTKADHQSEMERTKKIIKDRESYIKKLSEKMEDICSNFSLMLKGAVHQLKERIEVQGANNNGKAPIQNLMHESDYNYKSTA